MKGHTGIYRNIWDYIADVEPEEGGEPFRATFTELFEGFQGRQPDVGEKAPVTFDKKREVKFDRSALREEWKAVEDAQKSGFKALAEAPPGTPAPGGAGDFSTTMAAIAAARAAGDLDEVKRLKAEFAAARAAE
ncbi:MAG TPA: hypothetical protein VGC32_15695 [Solirubrobacterales bacterium]